MKNTLTLWTSIWLDVKGQWHVLTPSLGSHLIAPSSEVAEEALRQIHQMIAAQPRRFGQHLTN
jgi:hypothetical protein